MSTQTDERHSRRSSWHFLIAFVALLIAVDAWRQARNRNTLECEHIVLRSALPGESGACVIGASGDGLTLAFTDDKLSNSRGGMHISMKDNFVVIRDTHGTELARHALK